MTASTTAWSTMGWQSIVVWNLTPTPSGTHLRMEHSGFASERDASYKGAKYGWQNFIGKLEHLLAEVK